MKFRIFVVIIDNFLNDYYRKNLVCILWGEFYLEEYVVNKIIFIFKMKIILLFIINILLL